jgi:flagellar hook assembly protein FlgD
MKKRSIILIGIMLIIALGLMAKSTDNLLTFEVSPNPMDRRCNISLEFRTETAITLTIMDATQQVVKTLYSGPINKSASFTWERDDALGNFAPAGTYFVVVNYLNRYTSTKKTLILK